MFVNLKMWIQIGIFHNVDNIVYHIHKFGKVLSKENSYVGIQNCMAIYAYNFSRFQFSLSTSFIIWITNYMLICGTSFIFNGICFPPFCYTTSLFTHKLYSFKIDKLGLIIKFHIIIIHTSWPFIWPKSICFS
jgi:hypothetical protein